MGRRPALLTFFGGLGGSPIEDAVASARLAATLDTIETARHAGIERAILVSDRAGLDLPEGVQLVVDGDAKHHFGRKLMEVVGDLSLESVLYLGAGSVPLMREMDFVDAIEVLRDDGAVTNNRFSSDLVGWRVAECDPAVIRGVKRDNALARALVEASVNVTELPRTLETTFDIDTPSDLAILAVTGFGGKRLREAVAGLEIDTGRYRQALSLFVDRTKEVVVAGRVGTHAWQYLERETACRVRMLAEERGMEADGAVRGAPKSVLGFLLDATGLAGFFERLGELGDAAMLDTRVLLAHKGLEASRADRFLSDAGRWDEIENDSLRDFTRAALEASIPVLLGGHSLVSGGIMALNEFAWRQHDAGLMGE